MITILVTTIDLGIPSSPGGTALAHAPGDGDMLRYAGHRGKPHARHILVPQLGERRPVDQIGLFVQAGPTAAEKRILATDVDSLKPLEALNLLADLRKEIERSGSG